MAGWGCSANRTGHTWLVCAPGWPTARAPVLAVRAGFTLAALAGGIGLVAYLLLWLLTPAAEPDPDAHRAPRGRRWRSACWPPVRSP